MGISHSFHPHGTIPNCWQHLLDTVHFPKSNEVTFFDLSFSSHSSFVPLTEHSPGFCKTGCKTSFKGGCLQVALLALSLTSQTARIQELSYHSYEFKNKQLGLLSCSPCPPSPLLPPKVLWCHKVKPGAAPSWILHAALSASYWKPAGWEKAHTVQMKDKIHEQEGQGSGNMHTEAPQKQTIKVTGNMTWDLLQIQDEEISSKHLTEIQPGMVQLKQKMKHLNCPKVTIKT